MKNVIGSVAYFNVYSRKLPRETDESHENPESESEAPPE
jgi:hypothetical protein